MKQNFLLYLNTIKYQNVILHNSAPVPVPAQSQSESKSQSQSQSSPSQISTVGLIGTRFTLLFGCWSSLVTFLPDPTGLAYQSLSILAAT